MEKPPRPSLTPPPDKSEINFVTMSPVRTDAQKRGVPLDAATFLAEASSVRKRIAQQELHLAPDAEVPAEHLPHIHLIGDASVLAVEIARTNTDTRETIARLKAAFVAGNGTESPDGSIREATNERIRVVKSMAEAFGQQIRVVSAIELLKTQQGIAKRLGDYLAVLFNEERLKNVVDIAEMEKVCAGEKIPPDHNPDLRGWRNLLVATLPPRLRKLPTDQQLQESFYAAVEGLLAALIIEEQGYYASYKGPTLSNGKSIIDHMATLVRAVVFFNLQDTDFATRLRENFLVDAGLDGHGYIEVRGTAVEHVICDPHTYSNDSNSATNGDSSIVRKLPLLVFENGELRPVRTEEFRQAVSTGGGGVDGIKAKVWLSNLTSLATFYREDAGRLDSEVVEKALSTNGVTKEALKEWFSNVNARLEKTRNQEKPKSLDPILPAGNLALTCDLVAIMAQDLADRINKKAEAT